METSESNRASQVKEVTACGSSTLVIQINITASAIFQQLLLGTDMVQW